MTKLKIYCASKLHHAEKWRQLERQWPKFEFTARWIHMSNFDESTPKVCSDGWLVDEEDVRKCDVVMVYAYKNEELRGALVEAGMGIGMGKAILLVGESPSFGTWQFHPQVFKVQDLDAAHTVLTREASLRERHPYTGPLKV